MDCAEFEIALADYLDGSLAEPERSALEAHRAACAECAVLAGDAASAISFIERAAAVEPPPALVGRILQATNSGWELRLHGHGVRGWINRTFAPVLQPRFVMGAMVTLMSLTMLTRCAGAPKKTITAADLDPVRLWSALDDRAHRIWDRTVKGYESMRVVYEIRTEINDWKQQQAEADEAAAEAGVNSRKIAPEKTAAPAGQEKNAESGGSPPHSEEKRK